MCLQLEKFKKNFQQGKFSEKCTHNVGSLGGRQVKMASADNVVLNVFVYMILTVTGFQRRNSACFTGSLLGSPLLSNPSSVPSKLIFSPLRVSPCERRAPPIRSSARSVRALIDFAREYKCTYYYYYYWLISHLLYYIHYNNPESCLLCWWTRMLPRPHTFPDQRTHSTTETRC